MFANIGLYNILLAIAIISTLLFIFKLIIFVFTGGDIEVTSDFDSLSETEDSFGFFSIQSILSFFMGFGWGGLTAYAQYGLDAKISMIIAFVAGFSFMFLNSYLMFSVKKLSSAVKIDMNELADKTGKAYTSFKPGSFGQIEIELNNKLSVLDAINNSDEEIKAFEIIKVIKVENNKIYIRKGE